MNAPNRPRLAWVGLAAVLAGGAALRFWNIAAGLPYRVGADEPVIAERAIHIMETGDFNPHFFDYPGLYIYLQALVARLVFMVGTVWGSRWSANDIRPEHLYLWTRLLNAALGTVTILIAHRAGLRWGHRVALLAAGLLAVWPNHVRESHFALTDVPLTLLTTLALVLSMKALETRRPVWFVTAGASVGLAAATKYPGAIAIVMPLVAAAGAEVPLSARAWRAAGVAAAAAGAYVVSAPYTFLDLPAFLSGFSYLMTSYRPRSFESGAGIYLGHLNVALGWPGLIAVGSGFVLSTVRAIHDRSVARWMLVAVFPLTYFYVIATKDLIYARYLLPVLPPLCILMAIATVEALDSVSLIGRPRWLRPIAAVVFIGLVSFHAARASIIWPKNHGRRTTQDVAYRMVRQFIPEHSLVAVELAVLRLPDTIYRMDIVRDLSARSPEEYVSAGVSFVIASSDRFGPVYARPEQYPDAYRAYRKLLDEAAECLPTVEPTAALPGPKIRICRLRSQ